MHDKYEEVMEDQETMKSMKKDKINMRQDKYEEDQETMEKKL